MAAGIPRVRMSCTWMFVVVAFIGLIVSGCGQGDETMSDHASEDVASGATGAPGSAGRASGGSPDSGVTLSGSFRGVPEDQYTVEVAYELAGLDAAVNLADASPGEAIVTPSADVAELEIANTTLQRSTDIGPPHMYIALLYEKSTVPAAAINGTSQLSDWNRICEFRYAGRPYCGLGEFVFGVPLGAYDTDGDPATAVRLAPSEAITVDLGAQPLGLVVREQSARAVADFIRSETPHLVLVKPGDAGIGAACKYYVRDDVHPAVAHDRAAFALLDGNGTTIHEPPTADSSVPKCSDPS